MQAKPKRSLALLQAKLQFEVYASLLEHATQQRQGEEHAAPPRHQCRPHCKFLFHGTLAVCIRSGNYHECSADCPSQNRGKDRDVSRCCITGRSYLETTLVSVFDHQTSVSNVISALVNQHQRTAGKKTNSKRQKFSHGSIATEINNQIFQLAGRLMLEGEQGSGVATVQTQHLAFATPERDQISQAVRDVFELLFCSPERHAFDTAVHYVAKGALAELTALFDPIADRVHEDAALPSVKTVADAAVAFWSRFALRESLRDNKKRKNFRIFAAVYMDYLKNGYRIGGVEIVHPDPFFERFMPPSSRLYHFDPERFDRHSINKVQSAIEEHIHRQVVAA